MTSENTAARFLGRTRRQHGNYAGRMGGSAGEGCAGHGRVWDFVAVRGVTADGVAAGRCAAGGCTAGSSAGEGRVLMHRNDLQ